MTASTEQLKHRKYLWGWEESAQAGVWTTHWILHQLGKRMSRLQRDRQKRLLFLSSEMKSCVCQDIHGKTWIWSQRTSVSIPFCPEDTGTTNRTSSPSVCAKRNQNRIYLHWRCRSRFRAGIPRCIPVLNSATRADSGCELGSAFCRKLFSK